MKPEVVAMTVAGALGAGVETDAQTIEWEDAVKLSTSEALKKQSSDAVERMMSMLNKYTELSGEVKDYLRRDALNMDQVNEFLSKDGITLNVSKDGTGYRFDAADGEAMQFYFGDDLSTFSFMDKDGRLVSNVQKRASGDSRAVLVGDDAILDVEKSDGKTTAQLNDYKEGMETSVQTENGKYNMDFSYGDDFEISASTRKDRVSFRVRSEDTFEGALNINLKNNKVNANYEDFNDDVYVEGKLDLENHKVKTKVVENASVLNSEEGDFVVNTFSAQNTGDGYNISAKTVTGEREAKGRRISVDEVIKTDVSVSGNEAEIKTKNKDFVMNELARAKEMLAFAKNDSASVETVDNVKKETKPTTRNVAQVSTDNILEVLSDRHSM